VNEGIGVRNVLIVGADRLGQELAREIDANKNYRLVVKGFLDGNQPNDPRVLGKVEEFSKVVQTHFIDEVFITIPSERELVKGIALEARRRRVGVKVVPDLYDGLGRYGPFEYCGELPMISLYGEPIPVFGVLMKRTLDIAISSIGLLLSWPLFVAVAIAIKLDSPGPVFYCSPRRGKKGRKFILYKFRTMVPNANVLKEQMRHLSERDGPVFKLRDDPRITRLGKFLRRSSLDELPQLINVLKGEMSLVGPRPHSLDDCQYYRIDDLRRLDVMPGLTGLWQISARQDSSFEKLLTLDLKYIETWDFWLDIKILLRTIPAVLKGTGE
jgi:exopolysaccharide biosynthesis polyprenyl glycosylphosphotransferase